MKNKKYYNKNKTRILNNIKFNHKYLKKKKEIIKSSRNQIDIDKIIDRRKKNK